MSSITANDSGTVLTPISFQKAYISRIPIEIFSEILSYFEGPPEFHTTTSDLIPDPTSALNTTLKNLSLVCRHFYYHLFPLRFETVFLVNDETNQSKYKLSHYHRFCNAIVNGDVRARALAAYVRRCAIGLFDLEMTRAWAGKQLVNCATALSFMHHVVELHIFRTSITDDILNAMLSMSPLKALRLDDCNIPLALSPKVLRQFSALHATHIFMRGSYCADSDSADFLSSLCLSHTQSLTCTGTASFHLLRAFKSSGPLTSLTHLHIDVVAVAEYKDLLCDVFNVVPNLKYLHLGEIAQWGPEWEAFIPPYPAFASLPHLEYICAPTALLLRLVPQSCVSTVGIARDSYRLESGVYSIGPTVWDRLARAFQKSQRHIVEMDIPLEFYQSCNFALQFRHLRRLTLRAGHFNWPSAELWLAIADAESYDPAVEQFLDSWPDHPELSHLEMVMDDGSFESYHKLALNVGLVSVARLINRIPTLTSFALSRPVGVVEHERQYFLGEPL